jgi:DNA polymerase-3 subunit gamma/tau
MDIIELDAASNRGIDEIRDIRDKVNFAPVQGRRKVYIIDEAHMLTDAASNAFLKTLEEPPGHVIFVLCTTEAHRILPTIISRCQRLDFRRIPSETVFGRLAEIAEAEGVAVEPAALRIIARYAAGSLRDAENLLEQLVVSCPDGVTAAQVEKLLGMGSDETALELVKYLLLGNTTAALSAVNRAAWEGSDLRQLHRQASDLLRGFMHLQWGSEDAVDLPEHVQSQLREMVGQQPSWRIVHTLKIWGAVNMRYDVPSTLPLELAVVEICEESAAPAPVAEAPPAAPVQRASAPQPPRSAPVPREPRPERPPARQPASPPRTRESAPQPAATASGQSGGESSDLWVQWNNTVKALSRHKGRKYNLGALLRDCKVNSITLDDKTLTLPFTNKANLERMEEELEDPSSRQRLGEALAESFGEGCGYQLTLANGQQGGGNANRSSQQSPLVRAALGMGARILQEEEVEE